MRQSRHRARSPYAVPLRRGAALVTGGILVGCTIVQPVPTPPSVNGVMSWEGQAGQGTSPAEPDRCRDAWGFAGDLGRAMCEVDHFRLTLVARSSGVLNENAGYNAALWPAGVAVVFEKLRGATNANLLLPATVALGSYGFMNAGIPERQQAYLATARQLGCAILTASGDLYAIRDAHAPGDTPPLDDLAPPYRLSAALHTLRARAAEYEVARSELLASLKPKPGVAGAAPANSGEAILRQHRGKGDGSSPGADTRDGVAQETATRLNFSYRRLGEGTRLARHIDGAALRLRAERSRIEAGLHERLAAKAAPPADPTSIVAALLKSPGLLQAQAGERTQRASTAESDTLDAALPARLFDGLDPASQKALTKFQATHAAALRGAERAVSLLLEEHESRHADLKPVLAQAGCAVADAPPAAAPPPARASERRPTSIGGDTTPRTEPLR